MNTAKYFLRFVIWVASSVLAWSVAGNLMHFPAITAHSQIGTTASQLALSVFPVAIVLSLASFFALRPFVHTPPLTAVAILFGLPFSVWCGFFLEGNWLYYQSTRLGMALLNDGGNAFLLPSPAFTLLFAGLIFALLLLPGFRPGMFRKWRVAILWAAGVAAAFPVGWFTAHLLTEAAALQGALFGGVAGIVLYALLYVSEREQQIA